MNHREPPHLPVDSLRALHFVALLTLPALAPSHTHAVGRVGVVDSAPYLLAVGAPPLRFREAPPIPKVSTRPPAGASPIPNGETPAPLAAAKRPDVLLAPPPAPPAGDEATKPGQAPNSQPPPAAIIPDDTRPNVRPEDFLPFFQIPGAANAPAGVNVIAPVPQAAPAPAAIPASSATYTQSPR